MPAARPCKFQSPINVREAKVESEAKRILEKHGMKASPDVIIGPGTDFCPHAQRVLKTTWRNRCVPLVYYVVERIPVGWRLGWEGLFSSTQVL